MFTPQALRALLLYAALGRFSACRPGLNILTLQNDGAGIPTQTANLRAQTLVAPKECSLISTPGGKMVSDSQL